MTTTLQRRESASFWEQFCVVNGYIPVALSNSEGTGSVWVLAQLSGAHLFIQVLGNERTKRLQRARHFETQ